MSCASTTWISSYVVISMGEMAVCSDHTVIVLMIAVRFKNVTVSCADCQEIFFITFGNIFQFAATFCDFFQSWRAKLLKFARHGGLETLEGHFGFHFGGYFA